MAGIVRSELIARLEQHEDSFVERKPNASDLEPTLVAFANSVPEGREAIIYVGVRDNGEIIGVENTDSIQKKIQKMCDEICYPRIHFTTEIFTREEKTVLAVVIPPSRTKPHFAGPAYIRHGTKSIKATSELYENLITSRHSKAGELLRYKDKVVTVFSRKNQLGKPHFAEIVSGTEIGGKWSYYECRVLQVTPFYVTLVDIGSGRSFSEPLRNVEISYDNEKGRPFLIVRFDGA